MFVSPFLTFLGAPREARTDHFLPAWIGWASCTSSGSGGKIWIKWRGGRTGKRGTAARRWFSAATGT
jgi:hypothetical protein